MTLEEFLKHVYYTERSIVVPSMNRFRISKIQFMKRGKLDSDRVKTYLTELYNNKYK